ncbi:coiled-coil domain-containing protein 201 isoform X2 [Hemicordylus capensis]|uniref:coiled-coil domain-containing protein 201 isoform X2 n=1 Tax=Hemicordylus capensis TaxID=884348 RepID=UPI002302EE1A|nr:coiled-coil domain-containing protein 201 isoform X2 [Hemicordylus capensis]
MKRSKEKDISLRFKGMLEKIKVRHSTPEEASSTHTKTMISLGSLLNFSGSLSPMPKKSLKSAQTFEERSPHPETWHPWDLRELSIMNDHSEESNNSSQLMFPRRRLSTIIGSEESNEVLHQTVIPPMNPDKKTRDSRASHSKSNDATMEQPSKWQEAALKESTSKRKRKRNLDKKKRE